MAGTAVRILTYSVSPQNGRYYAYGIRQRPPWKVRLDVLFAKGSRCVLLRLFGIILSRGAALRDRGIIESSYIESGPGLRIRGRHGRGNRESNWKWRQQAIIYFPSQEQKSRPGVWTQYSMYCHPKADATDGTVSLFGFFRDRDTGLSSGHAARPCRYRVRCNDRLPRIGIITANKRDRRLRVWWMSIRL
jgi:hypothetical protein